MTTKEKGTFLKYLPKNMALLAQKLWRNLFCQNPFRAILRRKEKKKKKKFLMTTKPSGGGVKALFFCGLPYKDTPFVRFLARLTIGFNVTDFHHSSTYWVFID